jgi:hypothetical protein
MRYDTVLKKKTYNETVIDRRQNFIEHYETTTITNLTQQQISLLTFEVHIWKLGDKYHKLSSIYYGDPKYWWIIAYYNKKPTDAHVLVGDKLMIPTPLERVLNMIRVE